MRKGKTLNITERLMAGIMAIIMLASICPITALAEGEDTEPVEIAEITEPVEGYTFTIVSKVDGVDVPIEGAEVTVDGVGSDTTDADGKAVLPMLESEQTYNLTVTKFGYKKRTMDFTVADETSRLVRLTAITLVTVTGKVTEKDTEVPLAGVPISVTGYAEYSAVTNEYGEYSIEGVYSGQTYTVTAELKDYITFSKKVKLSGEYNFAMTPKGAGTFAFKYPALLVEYGQENVINTAKNADEYTSDDESIATIDENGRITTVGIGTTTIRAKRYETDKLLEGNAECVITVTKALQEPLVWQNTNPSELKYGDEYSNTVMGGTGDGEITYSSSDETIAKVDATTGKVTIVKPGTVTITAIKAEDDYHYPQAAAYLLTIFKAEQEPLVFDEPFPDAIFYSDNYTNIAKGGSIKDAEIKYTSSDEEVVKVMDGATIHAYKSGQATITATIEGNDYYEEVSASYTITVYKANQKADFLFVKGDAPLTIPFGREFSNPAQGGENEGITYASSDETIAKVDEDGVVTTFKAGTVTISATNAEDERFNSKTISYELTVVESNQVVTFEKTDIPTLTYGDSFTNGAKAMTNITYSSSDESVASVDDNGELTIHKAGEVTITAKAEATEQYTESTASYTITVKKAEQIVRLELGGEPLLTFNDNDNRFHNEVTSTAVTAGESGISPTYTFVSGESLVGDFDESTGAFTILGAGIISVSITFNENDRYNSATVSYTLTVNKDDQTISFPETAYELIAGQPFDTPEVIYSEHYGTGEMIYSVLEDEGGIIKSLNEKTGEIQLSYMTGSAVISAVKSGDENYNEASSEYSIVVTDWQPDTAHYTLIGDTKNDSGWFTGNVSVAADDGYLVSYDRENDENNEWSGELADAVTEDGGENTVSFYVREESTGFITGLITETVQKDTVYPTAEIKEEQLTGWEQLLTIITFNLWGKDTVDLTVESDDVTSKVARVECIIDDGITETVTKEQLDERDDWKEYSESDGIKLDKDQKAVVYAKVTDTAGNVTYASTNGIVFDGTEPKVELTVDTEPINGFFKGDVEIKVEVKDPAPYSGIKSVRYEVICDGDEENPTQMETLVEYNYDDPKYEELHQIWNSYEENKNIIVHSDSKLNNSDNVVVNVTAVDQSGNERTVSQSLKICRTTPVISVSWENDPEPVNVYENVSYYDTDRTAVITVTGRESVFDKPVITVNEQKGTKSYTINDWEYNKGETPDADIHTAKIEFTGSDTYDFTVEYTDKAGNAAETFTSEKFTVDHDQPTGTVTIGTNSWSDVVEVLTFHLWTNDKYEVTVEKDDATSPIKSVEYFKAPQTEVITTDQLEGVDWQPFDGLTVDKADLFTVYIRITDYAGQIRYLSTDGHIVDTSESKIVIEPEEANIHGIYKSDYVKVKIDIGDDEPYSGFKRIEYWVTCDGEETQRDVLYDFAYEVDETSSDLNKTGKLTVVETKITEKEDSHTGKTKLSKEVSVAEDENVSLVYSRLLQSWHGEIMVDSKLNNSDNVTVYVQVTDNAGNVSEAHADLKIDVTAPTIELTYDVDNGRVENDRGYFKTEREATVVITERTSNFIPEDVTVQLSAKDVNSDDITDDVDALLAKMTDNWNWVTLEGKTPDEATHTLKIRYTDDANYDFDISFTDAAGNVNMPVDTKESLTPYHFTVDKTLPEAAVTVNENVWSVLLEKLTFGLWSNGSFNVSANATDATSPFEMSYYISDTSEQLTAEELDALDEEKWTEYTEAFDIDTDRQFAAYIRVVDYANNCLYINSDGHILDKQETAISLTPDTPVAVNHDGVGIYNGSVNVLVAANENHKPYSGIQKVEYWVTCDGKETQRKTLYRYDYTRDSGTNNNGGKLTITADGEAKVTETGVVPTQEQLRQSFSTTITVDKSKNNSSDVKVYAAVTDNAGNYNETVIPFDIDTTHPTISVTYDNNEPYRTVDDNGFYPAERIATIVITERTNHFEWSKASAGIKITAKDVHGRDLTEVTDALYEKINDEKSWVTVEGGKPDEATHTMTIRYSEDANYTFSIGYTDMAENANKPENTNKSATPYSFTVDKTKPDGTVTVNGFGTWDELIGRLTFGLWSKNTVEVRSSYKDTTSPVETFEYYKTAETEAKQFSDLNAIKNWTAFTGFTGDSVVDFEEWSDLMGFDVAANEQFTVYIKIVDYAGNVNYISTNGVIVDDTLPVVENVKPEITITPEPYDGIYNRDVTIAVKVVDPIENNTYSGLKEIRYVVSNMGNTTQSGTLFRFGIDSPTKAELVQKWEDNSAIVVDRNLNNSNDVRITVYAVDNADNNNEAFVDIMIDVTDPTISVRYDNNDGDTAFADSTTDAFFKANRQATIVVTERNFNPDLVTVTITNTDGVIPALSGWSTSEAGGNGDGTTHTATILYSSDGDYTFDISCTDRATNPSQPVDYGGNLAPQKFTVDKTVPTVSVSYDNNDARNGNYYNAQRRATISVVEHNFETSRVVVKLTASDDGVPVSAPAISGWSRSGDTNTATILYDADAYYTFDFDYIDKAGNPASDIAEQSFYVDKTNPVVTISNIVDESANNDSGNIGFELTATDTNFDVFEPVLTAVMMVDGEIVTKQLEIGSVSSVNNGRRYTVANLDKDGIYRVICTVVDKAGNAYSEVILENADGTTYPVERTASDSLVTFSVNRNGSTYEVSKETIELVGKTYVQHVNNNVVLVEINADPLSNHSVTVNDEALTENMDYSVEHEGGRGNWNKYTYTVDKSLFENEGEYNIVASSKDKATNDAFSDVKGAAVSFVVDRTAPVVTVSGLTSNGRYQTDKQRVTLIPTDDGGALKSLEVYTVDNNGSVISELVNLEDQAFETALAENDGKITFNVGEGLYQNIRIICDDMADYGEEKNVISDQTITNVSISSSALKIFWANKPARYGTIGGVSGVGALAAGFVVARNRKKEK